MSEAELLAPVLDGLRANGWAVYEEVSPWRHGLGHRCDAYATVRHGALTVGWAIEAKRSLSLALIEQAEYWTLHAHYVSVVVPWSRHRSGYGARLLQRMGVGIIRVRDDGRFGYDDPWVASEDGPRLHRPQQIPELHENQRRQGLAGTNGGGFWTPFQETLHELTRALPEGEPRPFKEVLESISHHYAHARSGVAAISALIRSGTIKGCRLSRGGRTLLIERTERAIYTGDEPPTWGGRRSFPLPGPAAS